MKLPLRIVLASLLAGGTDPTWATRRIKASVGYGDIDLDRFGLTGNTKTVLTRLQWIY